MADRDDYAPPERHEIDEHDYDLADFYATDNFAEVEILVEVLEDHGIHCFTRKMDMPGLPTDTGDESEIRIVVQDNRLAEAHELLEEAIAEANVPDDGGFLHTELEE